MEENRITSFWLVFIALASLALPAAPQQKPAGTPEAAAASAPQSAPSTLTLPRHWLPAPAPEALKNEYAYGVRAQKARQWARAALHFEHVLQWDANHREAPKRLAQVLKSLEQQEPARRLESYYSEGTAAMTRQDWRLALLAFQKITALDPQFRDAGILLSQVIKTMHQQYVMAHTAAVSGLLVDSLQVEAAKAMARAEWLAAVIALEKIAVLKPGHANTSELLAHAYRNLQEPKTSAAPKPSSSVPWSTLKLAAAFFLLPTLGYLFFSPSVRATLYFMQGNLNNAVRVYERLVARNPARVQCYGKLAQAYLQLGRRDEAALKAYQIVLQLNLLTPGWREKINGVVAQYYLAEGRNDKDAIAVFEEALAYELHKQQNRLALIKAGPNGITVKNA